MPASAWGNGARWQPGDRLGHVSMSVARGRVALALRAPDRIDRQGAYANLAAARELDRSDLEPTATGGSSPSSSTAPRACGARATSSSTGSCCDRSTTRSARSCGSVRTSCSSSTSRRTRRSARPSSWRPARRRGFVNADPAPGRRHAGRVAGRRDAAQLSRLDRRAPHAPTSAATTPSRARAMNEPASRHGARRRLRAGSRLAVGRRARRARHAGIASPTCARPRAARRRSWPRAGAALVAASDVRPSRAALVADNVRGSGSATRRRCSWPTAGGLRTRAESFDRVLVDAPCSGLGTLRRRADARWRIDEDSVDRSSRCNASSSTPRSDSSVPAASSCTACARSPTRETLGRSTRTSRPPASRARARPSSRRGDRGRGACGSAARTAAVCPATARRHGRACTVRVALRDSRLE